MPKFSVSLTMMFNEVDFLDRFERAAKAGFKGIEYMFPYEWPQEQLIDALESNGLEQVLHNLPAGDWAAGERGIACIPGRENEFKDGVGAAIEYAKALRCPAVNCLVGLTPEGVREDEVRRTLVDNLGFAAAALEKEGLRFYVESLNDKDIPGFYLVRTEDALQLFEEVNHPNLRLQYDVYHMQIMEGNLIEHFRRNIDVIGHVHIAGVPGRNEPENGEIDYPFLMREIDSMGYESLFGLEYQPTMDHEKSLKETVEYLVGGTAV